MGIIILPVLFGALVMGAVSFFVIFKRFKEGTLNRGSLVFGVLLSLALYAGILLSYKIEGRVYALGPFFRFPILMAYIPFVVGALLFSRPQPTLRYLGELLLFSVFVSVFSALVLCILFDGAFFNVAERLHIPEHF